MIAREGSAIVRYYPSPVGGYESWMISYHQDGKRVRLRKRTRTDAAEEARRIVLRLASGSQAVSPGDLATLQRVKALAAETGVPPEAAAAEYARLTKRLPGVSIDALAECWEQHHTGIVDRTPADALREMLAEKRQAGRSAVWIRSLEVLLRPFGASLQKPFSSVSAQDVLSWFESGKWTGRSRNNRRAAVANLAAWAKTRRYLPADWPGLDMVPIATEEPKATEIFTPEEMRRLLVHARGPLRSYLAIAAFSGIRQAEILRLDWSAFRDEHIHLDAGRTKTRLRRLAPILPALRAWLPSPLPEGQVWPITPKGVARAIERLSARARVPWKRNGLRHSFASYRLAAIRDVPQVAQESGNTPAMIHRHYDALVTPAAAHEWFSIQSGSCDVL